MYTQRAPAVLRSPTVSVKQQWSCPSWCPLHRRADTATPAAPTAATTTTTSLPETVQATTVVVETASQPDLVPLAPPPPPTPRLPPPGRSFFGRCSRHGDSCYVNLLRSCSCTHETHPALHWPREGNAMPQAAKCFIVPGGMGSCPACLYKAPMLRLSASVSWSGELDSVIFGVVHVALSRLHCDDQGIK